MYMLSGLRELFLEALDTDLNGKPYTRLGLMERWNKECDEVYRYKNEIVDEYKTKNTPKVGTWIDYSSTMMKCSNCGRYTPRYKYEFCPHCGANMKGD